MDEMIKVVKVFAADPVNDLKKGFYTITIGNGTDNLQGTMIGFNSDNAPDALEAKINADGGGAEEITALKEEMTASIPE